MQQVLPYWLPFALVIYENIHSHLRIKTMRIELIVFIYNYDKNLKVDKNNNSSCSYPTSDRTMLNTIEECMQSTSEVTMILKTTFGIKRDWDVYGINPIRDHTKQFYLQNSNIISIVKSIGQEGDGT